MTQHPQTPPVESPENPGLLRRSFEAVRGFGRPADSLTEDPTPQPFSPQESCDSYGGRTITIQSQMESRKGKRRPTSRKVAAAALGVVAGIGGASAIQNTPDREALAQEPKITIPNKGEISDNEFNRAILTCRNDSVIDSSPNLYWTDKYPQVRNKRVITPSITSDQIRFQPDSNNPLWVDFFGGADKMNYNCDVWGGRDIVLRAVIKNPKTGKWQRNSKDVYAIQDSSQELREKKVPVRLFKPIKCLPGSATQNWGVRIITSGSFGNKPQVQDPAVYSTPKTGKSEELRLARQMPITTSQRKRILPC